MFYSKLCANKSNCNSACTKCNAIEPKRFIDNIANKLAHIYSKNKIRSKYHIFDFPQDFINIISLDLLKKKKNTDSENKIEWVSEGIINYEDMLLEIIHRSHNEPQYVSGDPGSGKSTLLYYLEKLLMQNYFENSINLKYNDKLEIFINNHNNKYSYDHNNSLLIINGEITDEEYKTLQILYPNKSELITKQYNLSKCLMDNIPIYVEAKDLANKLTDHKSINKFLNSKLNIGISDEEFTKLLKDKKLILLVDALDEANDIDLSKLNSLQELGFRMVITHRNTINTPETLNYCFNITPLSNEQKKEFCVMHGARLAYDFFEENNILDYADTPLILNLMLKKYKNYEDKAKQEGYINIKLYFNDHPEITQKFIIKGVLYQDFIDEIFDNGKKTSNTLIHTGRAKAYFQILANSYIEYGSIDNTLPEINKLFSQEEINSYNNIGSIFYDSNKQIFIHKSFAEYFVSLTMKHNWENICNNYFENQNNEKKAIYQYIYNYSGEQYSNCYEFMVGIYENDIKSFNNITKLVNFFSNKNTGLKELTEINNLFNLNIFNSYNNSFLHDEEFSWMAPKINGLNQEEYFNYMFYYTYFLKFNNYHIPNKIINKIINSLSHSESIEHLQLCYLIYKNKTKNSDIPNEFLKIFELYNDSANFLFDLADIINSILDNKSTINNFTIQSPQNKNIFNQFKKAILNYLNNSNIQMDFETIMKNIHNLYSNFREPYDLLNKIILGLWSICNDDITAINLLTEILKDNGTNLYLLFGEYKGKSRLLEAIEYIFDECNFLETHNLSKSTKIILSNNIIKELYPDTKEIIKKVQINLISYNIFKNKSAYKNIKSGIKKLIIDKIINSSLNNKTIIDYLFYFFINEKNPKIKTYLANNISYICTNPNIINKLVLTYSNNINFILSNIVDNLNLSYNNSVFSLKTLKIIIKLINNSKSITGDALTILLEYIKKIPVNISHSSEIIKALKSLYEHWEFGENEIIELIKIIGNYNISIENSIFKNILIKYKDNEKIILCFLENAIKNNHSSLINYIYNKNKNNKNITTKIIHFALNNENTAHDSLVNNIYNHNKYDQLYLRTLIRGFSGNLNNKVYDFLKQIADDNKNDENILLEIVSSLGDIINTTQKDIRIYQREGRYEGFELDLNQDIYNILDQIIAFHIDSAYDYDDEYDDCDYEINTTLKYIKGQGKENDISLPQKISNCIYINKDLQNKKSAILINKIITDNISLSYLTIISTTLLLENNSEQARITLSKIFEQHLRHYKSSIMSKRIIDIMDSELKENFKKEIINNILKDWEINKLSFINIKKYIFEKLKEESKNKLKYPCLDILDEKETPDSLIKNIILDLFKNKNYRTIKNLLFNDSINTYKILTSDIKNYKMEYTFSDKELDNFYKTISIKINEPNIKEYIYNIGKIYDFFIDQYYKKGLKNNFIKYCNEIIKTIDKDHPLYNFFYKLLNINYEELINYKNKQEALLIYQNIIESPYINEVDAPNSENWLNALVFSGNPVFLTEEIDINQVCNMQKMPDESFCHLYCTYSGMHAGKNMPVETFKEKIDEFARKGIKYLKISGGGEPLIHPQIGDMVTYAHKKGLEITLITNGIAFENFENEKLRKSIKAVLEHVKSIRISSGKSPIPDCNWLKEHTEKQLNIIYDLYKSPDFYEIRLRREKQGFDLNIGISYLVKSNWDYSKEIIELEDMKKDITNKFNNIGLSLSIQAKPMQEMKGIKTKIIDYHIIENNPKFIKELENNYILFDKHSKQLMIFKNGPGNINSKRLEEILDMFLLEEDRNNIKNFFKKAVATPDLGIFEPMNGNYNWPEDNPDIPLIKEFMQISGRADGSAYPECYYSKFHEVTGSDANKYVCCELKGHEAAKYNSIDDLNNLSKNGTKDCFEGCIGTAANYNIDNALSHYKRIEQSVLLNSLNNMETKTDQIYKELYLIKYNNFFIQINNFLNESTATKLKPRIENINWNKYLSKLNHNLISRNMAIENNEINKIKEIENNIKKLLIEITKHSIGNSPTSEQSSLLENTLKLSPFYGGILYEIFRNKFPNSLQYLGGRMLIQGWIFHRLVSDNFPSIEAENAVHRFWRDMLRHLDDSTTAFFENAASMTFPNYTLKQRYFINDKIKKENNLDFIPQLKTNLTPAELKELSSKITPELRKEISNFIKKSNPEYFLIYESTNIQGSLIMVGVNNTGFFIPFGVFNSRNNLNQILKPKEQDNFNEAYWGEFIIYKKMIDKFMPISKEELKAKMEFIKNIIK